MYPHFLREINLITVSFIIYFFFFRFNMSSERIFLFFLFSTVYNFGALHCISHFIFYWYMKQILIEIDAFIFAEWLYLLVLSEWNPSLFLHRYKQIACMKFPKFLSLKLIASQQVYQVDLMDKRIHIFRAGKS